MEHDFKIGNWIYNDKTGTSLKLGRINAMFNDSTICASWANENNPKKLIHSGIKVNIKNITPATQEEISKHQKFDVIKGMNKDQWKYVNDKLDLGIKYPETQIEVRDEVVLYLKGGWDLIEDASSAYNILTFQEFLDKYNYTYKKEVDKPVVEVGKIYRGVADYDDNIWITKVTKIEGNRLRGMCIHAVSKFLDQYGSIEYKNLSKLEELQIEDIQQYLPDGHPDKIVKDEFEFGKWYKDPDNKFLAFIKTENSGYGFDGIGEWFESSRSEWELIDIVLASDEEVELHLLEEARRRYPIGAKIKSALKGSVLKARRVDEIGGIHYTSGRQIIWNIENDDKRGFLYDDGNWAEIIENAPKKEEPTRKFKVGDKVKIVRKPTKEEEDSNAYWVHSMNDTIGEEHCIGCVNGNLYTLNGWTYVEASLELVEDETRLDSLEPFIHSQGLNAIADMMELVTRDPIASEAINTSSYFPTTSEDEI